MEPWEILILRDEEQALFSEGFSPLSSSYSLIWIFHAVPIKINKRLQQQEIYFYAGTDKMCAYDFNSILDQNKNCFMNYHMPYKIHT